jgi:hypothetical protein
MSRKRTGRAAWRALAATLAAATGVLAASAGAAQANTAQANTAHANTAQANTAHAGLTAAAGYHLAAGAHAATQSGGHLALDAVSANGEFNQEIPASYGESYVASAWLSAQSGPASGQLCLGAVCHQYNLTPGTQTLVQVGDLDTAGDELLFQNNVTVGSTTVADPSFVASELQSGSFEGTTPTGWAKMVPSGATVNMALYNTADGAPAAAQDGDGYLAFNSNASGGGVYQDVLVDSAAPGTSYVATAWLSAQSGTASGDLCVWGLGAPNYDSPNTDNCHPYSVTAGTYTPVQLVYDVPDWISTVRFQLYATPNGGTTDMDTTSLSVSDLTSGSFEGSTPAGWLTYVPSGATVNMALYNTADGAPAAPQDGKGYLAFNTNTANGSVYQDYAYPMTGTSYVGTAWLSAQSGTASGELCVWGLSPNTNSLPNTDSCQPYTVTAGTYTPVQVIYDNVYGTSLRFQVYPTPNGGTTDMDTASLMQTPTIDG